MNDARGMTRRGFLGGAAAGVCGLSRPGRVWANGLGGVAGLEPGLEPGGVVVGARPCLFAATHRYPPPLEGLLLKLDPATDVFPTEVYCAEMEAVLAGWAEALKTGARSAVERVGASVTEDVTFAPFVERSAEVAGERAPLRVERLRFDGATGRGRAALEQGVAGMLGSFATVEVAEFELFGVRVLSVGEGVANEGCRVEAEVLYTLAGAAAERVRQQVKGTWTLGWRKQAGVWKVERWAMGPATRSRLAGRGCVDVTAECVDPNGAAMRQLSQGMDAWRSVLDAAVGVDVYGNHGVAVGDIDGSGLDSVYVCQPAGLPNRLLRNRGDGTFADISESSGTGLLDGTASAIFADFLNRGRQDLLVVRSAGPMLFRNEGDGRFTVVKEAFRFGTEPQGTFTSAAVADYDGDGLLDVYLCVYSYYEGLNQYQFPSPYYDAQNGPPNFLFRNRGDGTFEDVTAASGVGQNNNRFSFAAEWVDLRGTGRPDLYVANDFGRKNLYRNKGGGRFEDVAGAAGVEDYGPGMSVCALDADGDGRLDLYVANMWLAEGKRITEQKEFLPGVAEEVRALYRKHNAGNSLFRNEGDGRFQSEGERAGVARGGWSWSCGAWDVLQAGRPDVYVLNGFVTGSQRPDLQSFFWRQVAQRSMVSGAQGAAGGGAQGAAGPAEPGAYEAAWNAVNELLRSDYSWSGSQRNVFLRNGGDGVFDDVAGVLGLDLLDDSRAFALADLDGDGRLEVVVKNRTGPQLRVLRNEVEGIGRAVSLRLRGTRSNRDAIGAMVTVEVEGRRQVRQLSAGSGFASQHSKEMVFGVGASAGPVGVTVRWPSGQTGHWADLRAGMRYVLEEGREGAQEQAYAARREHTAAVAAGPPVGAPGEDAVVSTWLAAPLYGPALRLRAVPGGEAVPLQGARGSSLVVVLVGGGCAGAGGWLEELAAAVPELRRAGGRVVLVTEEGSGFPAAAAHGLAVATVARASLEAWSVQMRYLYDRRRDLRFPTTLLLNGDGAVVRVHQGAVRAAVLLDDVRRQQRGETASYERAVPYPGPLYGRAPQRNDFTMGVAFVQYGFAEEAEAAFRRAVRARPEHAAAWFNLGTILLNSRRFAEAEPCLRKATELDPKDADAWNNLGLVRGEQGAYEGALEAFRRAALLGPGSLLAVENMMRIYQFQGRAAEAVATLKELLARSPEVPELHLAMGMARVAEGDTEAGKSELLRAIALRPGYVDARNDLGTLYLKAGDARGAEEQFDRCRALAPDFDRAVLNEAVLYARTGRGNEAVALLRGFLARHPENADVRALLQRMGG